MNKQIPPVFTIQSLEALRVIADPLRAQIYELLVDQPQTVRQVADKLGEAPARLYYHFGLLESQQLIRTVETRQVANLLEKTYQAAAARLEVHPSLLTFDDQVNREPLLEYIASTMDTTREDLLRSIRARLITLEQGEAARPRQVLIHRELRQISEEQAAEFHQRLNQLIEAFAQTGSDPDLNDSRGQTYGLTIAFYPNFYYPEFPAEK